MPPKVASKGLALDGLGEASSKKPKKAGAAKVGAGKRKVMEGEEIVNGSDKRPGASNGVELGGPALRNGDEVNEEGSPAPAKKGRKVVKAKVPAKGKKSAANAQAAELLGRKMRNGGGAENLDSGSEEDMFAASPSPAKTFAKSPSHVKKFAASASPVKKVVNREFKEMGSQVLLQK